MPVYLRGNTYWAEYTLAGKRFRFSTKSKDKKAATQIEQTHRQSRIDGKFGVKDQTFTLTTVADAFTAFLNNHASQDPTKKSGWKAVSWSESTLDMHLNAWKHLSRFFASRIMQELTEEDLVTYRNRRMTQTPQPSNRTVNIELGTMRQILTENRLWLKMMEGSTFKKLKENKDVGRALPDEEVSSLLKACRVSNSKAIYPAVKLSVYTGLRSAELKGLTWGQINFEKSYLVVGTSKTEAGTRRQVSLNRNAIALLLEWKASFPDALPTHYVFPSTQYRMYGKKGGQGLGKGEMRVWKMDPTQPMKSFQSSWDACREAANVECRWHDLRHTAATRMAQEGADDRLLMRHFGWMSRKMIDHYAHVRAEFGKSAVAAAFDNWNIEQMFHIGEEVTIQ